MAIVEWSEWNQEHAMVRRLSGKQSCSSVPSECLVRFEFFLFVDVCALY